MNAHSRAGMRTPGAAGAAGVVAAGLAAGAAGLAAGAAALAAGAASFLASVLASALGASPAPGFLSLAAMAKKGMLHER